MKKFFSDGVLTAGMGLLACSLSVGLALVYAMHNFI